MSFNLHFEPSDALTREAFDAHFAKRRGYAAAGSQVDYRCPDTGVYFGFDWQGGGQADSAAAGSGERYAASFEINLGRPSVFGLEAEKEVTAFVEHFACGVPLDHIIDAELFTPSHIALDRSHTGV